MSVVTSIVMTCAFIDDRARDTVFDAIKSTESTSLRRPALAEVTGSASGVKGMTFCVYCGAYSYLDEDVVIKAFLDAPWKWRSAATLIVGGEQQHEFARVFKPRGTPFNDHDPYVVCDVSGEVG